MRRPNPIIDYSEPPPPRSRLLELAVMLGFVTCFIATILCGLVTLNHLKERHYTPEFTAYLATISQKRKLNPHYVDPPFAGQQTLQEHVWSYSTTYGALVFPVFAVGLFIFGRPLPIRR
jgi:hypothetical protein